ncbi:metallophosphoesterase family protein [Lacticaseibacillus pabuli]|uniref:Metallophosphoesterase family protein n=1 Tax=Lacticaseibacillus pabuli TaxID=3025672 RepID=A0ABY7WVC6_9LACO|nr:metallophosphoesterase [Lacticaseibacillus sp. KACC 23028]WDF83423.1 metallophosphoesterase family protein [Lacticaseibacillus sp. KACC 23028]
MQFFIADTHFFHSDLLGYNDFAPRLFSSTEAMDQALIGAWNARVDDNDVVYHLGDIAMNPENFPTNEAVLQIILQLHGRIVFIKGNHDYRRLFKYLQANDPMPGGKPKFSFHDVGAIIKIDHQQLFLTHYPLMLGIVTQTLNLHGHIHNSSVRTATNINVGVDSPERELLQDRLPWGSPLKMDEIEEIAQRKAEQLAKMR